MNADLTEVRREAAGREDVIAMRRSLLQLLGCVPEDGRCVVSLKTLYTDFVVRELSPTYAGGAPLTLELERPQAPEPRKRAREAAVHDSSEQTSPSSFDGVYDALKDVLTSEDFEALKRGLESSEEKFVLSNVTTKEARVLVHQTVKKLLGSTHLSSTDQGKLTIAKTTAAGRREQRQRGTPLRQRTFLHFTVYKENIDSAHAFRLIAKHLHLSTRQIEFCGTKDKRAVTLQRVAIRDIDPSRIRHLNVCSFGPHHVVKVGGFQVCEKGLRLGDSSGNHFTIVLRLYPGQHLPHSLVPTIEAGLTQHGVINYFGPQRFGTTQVLTSDIGLLILRGELKEAILLMLQSKASIIAAVRASIQPLRDGDYVSAMNALPHFCLQERDLMRHLVQNPNDFLGALQTLPRTLAMLYIHAIQSLVWNEMASSRLSGPSRATVEAGDVVLEKVYEARCASAEGGSAVPLTFSLLREDDNVAGLPAVRVLQASDPLSRFHLSDVLLPIPGPDENLIFPTSEGCTRSDYEQRMADLRIGSILLSSGDADQPVSPLLKLFHFHGAYRPLVVRLEQVKLTALQAPSWTTPLIETDLARLQVVEGSGEAAVEAKPAPSANAPVDVFRVEFSLPPGSYATSVLREFTVFSYHTHAAAVEEADDADKNEEKDGEE